MIADELRALAVHLWHLWPNAILHAEILDLADRVEAVERDAARLDCYEMEERAADACAAEIEERIKDKPRPHFNPNEGFGPI